MSDKFHTDTFSFLLSMEIPIKVFSTDHLSAFSQLHQDKFTHVNTILNKHTDRQANMSFLIAYNINTDESCFIILITQGDSYLKHVIGQLLLFKSKIQKETMNYLEPKNLTIYQRPITTQDYQLILDQNDVTDVNHLFIGNQRKTNHHLLQNFSIKSIKYIDNPLLRATVIELELNGSSTHILTAPISPWLYGEKAGLLITALHSRGLINTYFSGRCGTLDSENTQMGAPICPTTFISADFDPKQRPLQTRPKPALPLKDLAKLGFHVGGTHASTCSVTTEGQDRIKMLTTIARSIDCEAALMAVAAKTTDTGLTVIMIPTDAPGTQFHINRAGRASQSKKETKHDQTGDKTGQNIAIALLRSLNEYKLPEPNDASSIEERSNPNDLEIIFTYRNNDMPDFVKLKINGTLDIKSTHHSPSIVNKIKSEVLIKLNLFFKDKHTITDTDIFNILRKISKDNIIFNIEKMEKK